MGFGWVSGIFSTLRRKPKFKVSLIEGPTFCCSYHIGKTREEYEVHRTGIALYLKIANIGSAASSIVNISIGYHWHVRRFSLAWFRYSIGWFWLHNQAASLTDFQAKIGDNIKVFPFLTQANYLVPMSAETFLQVGQSTNGVVYFEQSDSWGACFPLVWNGLVRVKVVIGDVFGQKHSAKFSIPSFGTTLSALHGEPLPFDTSGE